MRKPAICLSRLFLILLNLFLLMGLDLSAQDSTQSTHSSSPPSSSKESMVSPAAKEGMIAPNPPFWGEIAAFKKQDSLRRPPEKAILFVGSSSFRKWTN